MPAPHPLELRKRVIKAWEKDEETFQELADRFLIGVATVERWVTLKRNTGSVKAKPMGGSRRPFIVDKEGESIITEILDNNPEITLSVVCELYFAKQKVVVSQQTMSDTVRRLGYTKKKELFEGWQRIHLKQ